MELATSRLRLRPYANADAADLYAWSADPRVGPIAGWRPHKSLEESLSVIRTVLSGPDVFALEEKDSGRVIGSIGLTGSHPLGSGLAVRMGRSAMRWHRCTGAGD